MKRTGPTSLELKNLIVQLREKSSKEKVKIWKRVADDLSYSTRRRREVNLHQINKHAKDKETVVVPGKVLGDGSLDKHVTVAAWQFSKSAIEKLGKNAVTIHDLMESHPKRKGVRILG